MGNVLNISKEQAAEILLKTLTQENEIRKAAGTSNSAQLIYQPGGLFATDGLPNQVISAIPQLETFVDKIPAYPAVDTQPFYTTLTEIGGESGNEPTEVCDDGPVGGVLKGATLTARFGRIIRSTETIELGATAERLNRGVFEDLTIVGALAPDSPFIPGGMGQQGNPLDSIFATQMLTTGTALHRKIANLVWNGDPANGNGGGYEEFPGMEQLVVTGHVDAKSNTAAPALDSTLINANYGVVGDGYDLVGLLQALDSYMDDLGSVVGGVNHGFVMRKEAWREICQVWPVQYNTQFFSALYNGDNATRLNMNADSLANARDAMMASRQITISGRTYPVFIDNSMPKNLTADDANIGAGEFGSDIYMVPLSIAGNIPTMYWEYLDWARIDPMLRQFGAANSTFWTDGGRFLWGIDFNGSWCIKLKVRVEPRLILRTPQYAARIYNLKFRQSALPHRDPLTFSGGGDSTRTAPTTYATWMP